MPARLSSSSSGLMLDRKRPATARPQITIPITVQSGRRARSPATIGTQVPKPIGIRLSSIHGGGAAPRGASVLVDMAADCSTRAVAAMSDRGPGRRPVDMRGSARDRAARPTDETAPDVRALRMFRAAGRAGDDDGARRHWSRAGRAQLRPRARRWLTCARAATACRPTSARTRSSARSSSGRRASYGRQLRGHVDGRVGERDQAAGRYACMDVQRRAAARGRAQSARARRRHGRPRAARGDRRERRRARRGRGRASTRAIERTRRRPRLPRLGRRRRSPTTPARLVLERCASACTAEQIAAELDVSMANSSTRSGRAR